MKAAVCGHFEIFVLLLERGADLNICDRVRLAQSTIHLPRRLMMSKLLIP